MASYLVNQSPMIDIACNIPFEVWFEKPTNYLVFGVFSSAYDLVNVGKLDVRVKMVPFLGTV